MSKQTILASAANITTNYLPRYNGTGYVNSVIFDNGTNIGIGTNTPYEIAPSNVNIDIRSATYSFLQVGTSSTATASDVGYLEFMNGNNKRLGTIAGGADGTALAGYMRFSTANSAGNFTERMRITSSGNVGIGTSSPSRLLSLYATTPVLQFINPTTGITSNDGTQFYQNAENFFLELQDGGYYSISTGGSERMRITSAGLVGIGTSSPASASGSYGSLDIRGAGGGGVVFGTTTTLLAYLYGDVAGLNIQTTSSKPIIFLPNGDERARISSAGGFQVTAGASSGDTSFIVNNAANNATYFRVRGDGYLQSVTTWNNSTSNAANMSISSNGYIERSTSSLKYKKEIRDYDKGLAEVMTMRPVYYKGKNPNDGDKQFAGLIAEDIHDLGLTEFVTYAQDGSPDALAYQNMVALLTKAIQELSQKVSDQQEQINQLINK